jgi:site-specific DNA recombinase
VTFRDVSGVGSYESGSTCHLASLNATVPFEALQDAIDRHDVDVVVVWKLDRLVRRPAEFERLWERCENRGVALASVTEPIDTSTDLGVAIVRILVTFAGLETSTMGVRQAAKARENAYRGKPPGGPAAFGHTPGYTAVVPAEAELIREAAGRVIAGESYERICIDWAARGVLGKKGGWLRPTTLRHILDSPRLTGDRVYKGEVAARDCLPAILDRETAATVRAAMAYRSRRQPYGGSKYLLTGLLRCGRCGAPMFGRRRTHSVGYQCARPIDGGCGRIFVVSGPLERHVLGQYFAHLPPANRRATAPSRPSAVELEAAVDAHVRNLDAIRIQRHVERTLTKAQFIDAATRLAAQLQHRIGGPSTTKQSQPWTGSKQIRGAWNTLELRQRKALLGAHIHYIIINPVGRQSGSRFHPSRTDIVWWGDPDPLYDPIEPDQLPPIDPHWLRTQLDDGRTYPSLGRELGCSATRIRRYAIDHDMRSKAKTSPHSTSTKPGSPDNSPPDEPSPPSPTNSAAPAAPSTTTPPSTTSYPYATDDRPTRRNGEGGNQPLRA